jgi:hypothetical protein
LKGAKHEKLEEALPKWEGHLNAENYEIIKEGVEVSKRCA